MTMAENGGKRQSRNSGDKKSRRRGDGVEKKAYVPGSRGRPPKWFNELAATEAAAIISAAAAAVSATQATRYNLNCASSGNSTAEPSRCEQPASNADSLTMDRSN